MNAHTDLHSEKILIIFLNVVTLLWAGLDEQLQGTAVPVSLLGLATWSLELRAIHPWGPLGMVSYLPVLQREREAFPESKVTRSPNQIPLLLWAVCRGPPGAF